MNYERRQELREWSARLKGWVPDTLNRYYIQVDNTPYGNVQMKCNIVDWTPDLDSAPASQILSVIERMRELGWKLFCVGNSAVFKTLPTVRKFRVTDWFQEDTLPKAILEAAFVTGVK